MLTNFSADQEGEVGTLADEADVEVKSDALESAVWRLTAGKGGHIGEALSKLGSIGGTDAAKAAATALAALEPISERRTAAGRMDFVLQVSVSNLLVSIQ